MCCWRRSSELKLYYQKTNIANIAKHHQASPSISITAIAHLYRYSAASCAAELMWYSCPATLEVLSTLLVLSIDQIEQIFKRRATLAWGLMRLLDLRSNHTLLCLNLRSAQAAVETR